MPVQLTKRLLESSTIRALGDPETNTRFAEVITGFDRNERYSQKLLSVAETRGNIMVDTTKPASNKMSGNQGEGNREAAKAYNKSASGFARGGKVEPAAREAVKSMQGPEKASLERAEAEGRSHKKE
jgi:hypothetical protein